MNPQYYIRQSPIGVVVSDIWHGPFDESKGKKMYRFLVALNKKQRDSDLARGLNYYITYDFTLLCCHAVPMDGV